MNTLTTQETMELVEDMATDDDDDGPSSPEGSGYEEGNLLSEALENEVTAQLVKFHFTLKIDLIFIETVIFR